MILQATRVFTRVVVAVGVNRSKKALFSEEERLKLLRETTDPLKNVEVVSFEGLLADYCKSRAQEGKVAIVRGLRAVSDFESEMAIASLNLQLSPETPTVFFPTEASLAYVSSSAAKEMALYKGAHEKLTSYVPPVVAAALIEKFYGPPTK